MALPTANSSARTFVERRLRDGTWPRSTSPGHLSISPDASLLLTLNVMNALVGTLAQAAP